MNIYIVIIAHWSGCSLTHSILFGKTSAHNSVKMKLHFAWLSSCLNCRWGYRWWEICPPECTSFLIRNHFTWSSIVIKLTFQSDSLEQSIVCMVTTTGQYSGFSVLFLWSAESWSGLDCLMSVALPLSHSLFNYHHSCCSHAYPCTAVKTLKFSLQE